MEIISFSCPNCGHGMRIGADKGGKRARCPRCKDQLTIPLANQAEDGEGGVYQLLDETSAVPEPEDGKSAKVVELDPAELLAKRKQRIRELASLRKAPILPEQWQRVRTGLLFVAFAALVGLASFGLQRCVLAVGLLFSPEYAYLAGHVMVDPNDPGAEGRAPTLYRAWLVVGLMGGSSFVGLWMLFFVLSYLLTMAQLGITGFGHLICAAGPDRYGARSLALAVVVSAGVCVFIVFLFQFLPTTGIFPYLMIPMIAPEVASFTSNVDRMDPIHVTWAASPFWEGIFVIILRMSLYAPAVFSCVFLHATVRTLQDEVMQPKTNALIRLILGIAFIDLGFLLLMDTGTSEILILLLRGIFALYIGFSFWFLIWFILIIMEIRIRIQRTIRLATL